MTPLTFLDALAAFAGKHFVSEWRSAHKWLSVQGAILIVLLDVIASAVPGLTLPDHVEAVIATLIAVGRLIQQGPPSGSGPSAVATPEGA